MKRLNKNSILWLTSLLSVAFFCLFLLGCGSARIGSINHRDDTRLNAEDKLIQQRIRSNTLAVDNQELDLMHKEQAGKILTTNNNQPTPSNGLVDGIAINDYYQTTVRFEVILGNQVILDQTVGPRQRLPLQLPINASGYTVIYYEDGSKGEFERARGRLVVTNLKNRGFNGTNYYFILRNGAKI